MQQLKSVTVLLLLVAIAAGCSSGPTPWETFTEQTGSEGDLDSAYEMGVVIEQFNEEYEQQESLNDCDIARNSLDITTALLAQTMVSLQAGETENFAGGPLTHTHDYALGRFLAKSYWLDQNC